MVTLPFRDRGDAARQLSGKLERYRGSDPVVLAIPRGAVPMGRVIADALEGELDVVLVRKIGAPGNPELAIGAIDEQGRVMLADSVGMRIDAPYVRHEAQRQLALIRERRARYRPGEYRVPVAGRTAIVVDDGLATGSTMIAALKAVRAQRPARLVCAVPVAAAESLAHVSQFADDVVCLATPARFGAVGAFYEDFTAVTDDEVISVLARPRLAASSVAPASHGVRIPADHVILEGDQVVPPSPKGLVIFVHGSGSSRLSPRNRFVASALNQRGLATLLFDLLTPAEDRDPASRFDIPLLARRLDAALSWVESEPGGRLLRVGLFGSSTGAAAALIAAAARPAAIAAVVSRGGRPDLAGRQVLSAVRTPTLLIVGGNDAQVLMLNRQAEALMSPRAQTVVIPGATHLFEEPGALEQVAMIAGDWLVQRLAYDA